MRVLLLALVLMLVPTGQAGSVDDPEISDAGDTEHPESAHDLATIYLEQVDLDAGPALAINLLIEDDFDQTGALFAWYESYKVMFSLTGGLPDGMSQVYVDFRPSQASETAGTAPVPVVDPEDLACRMGIVASDDAWVKVSNEIRLEDEGLAEMVSGSHWRCTVPYDKFDGFDPASHQVIDLYAKHRQMVRGPLSGDGDVAPDTAVYDFDRAPDTGFGRVFVPPAPPGEAPEIAYENVTEFPFLNETTEATSASVQYNWTGIGGYRFLGEVESGSFDVNVSLDGETVFAWNGNATNGTTGFDAIVNETCDICAYAAQVTMTDFVGMVGFDLAPDIVNGTIGQAPAVSDGAEGDVDVDDGVNETVDDASDDQESPGFALPLLMAILVALVAARRLR